MLVILLHTLCVGEGWFYTITEKTQPVHIFKYLKMLSPGNFISPICFEYYNLLASIKMFILTFSLLFEFVDEYLKFLFKNIHKSFFLFKIIAVQIISI